ncbi:PQQ-binding-like beta-propeller repeat protein [Rhodococcus sp. NPDC047139]|uniref:Rv3212 family protein n=1 Tax=Rhodococcus sp. NPDC047139 TaxID=3155141 RepID=UPI0033F9DB55
MLAPERRTRTDLLVAAALVVTVLVAASVVWLTSDARGTTSTTWDGPVPTPAAPQALPRTLAEAWRAASAATTAPVVSGGTIATADGGAVIGRDPLSGEERWRYERDRALCAATEAWGDVVSVYRDRRGCGQVTALDAATGARVAQRTGDTDDPVHLVDTGSHLIALGSTRLEMWRSDLVRTIEYGRVDAPVNPKVQPRSGCELRSADSGAEVLAVLERCANEPSGRLTLLEPSPEDSSKPEQFASSVLPEAGADARIVAVVGDRTAVYLPPDGIAGARIEVFDGDGTRVDTHALPRPAGASWDPAIERGGVLVWWTGRDTVALSTSDFAPQWTVEGTLGNGDILAGSLLLPVDGALMAVDSRTGRRGPRIDVERGAVESVNVAVAGEVVVEQRGDEVVALR